MADAETYQQLIDLATGASVAKGEALVELGAACVALQPAVLAGERCDLLLDSVRASIADLPVDPRGATRQLSIDLAEVAREARREQAVAAPDPAAEIRISLRWVGPPDDAELVAAHFDPDAVSWPTGTFGPPSRFETVLRIGDTVRRPHLDNAIGAALRQLPDLLDTAEGDEPPEHWWAGGRLELIVDLPALDGSRSVALSGAVASRLGLWGATLALDIHD